MTMTMSFDVAITSYLCSESNEARRRVLSACGTGQRWLFERTTTYSLMMCG